ncbi:MAG: hypothetical protein JW940_27660 [Polyangiaceae bacterium]|nr:hypothetical protein [Polyangiaceae bacterium]
MKRQLHGLVTLGAALALVGCTFETADEGTTAQSSQDWANMCSFSWGLNPTKAALAVAMATELGRLDPLKDLTWDWGQYQVVLTPTGLARCSNDCANTKAILGLQSEEVTQIIDQNVFSPTNLKWDLYASFQRQKDWNDNITRNMPWMIPEEHTLVRTGGPLSLGTGACGPHYTFRATKPSGAPLSNASNLQNNLVFFGLLSGNTYLAFTTLNYNGNANIALDPTDGDNALPVTTSGSCPTYENDRVYDRNYTLLGKCCITVLGYKGSLQKITRAPGYLGCKKS